jgi:hypothetical protein
MYDALPPLPIIMTWNSGTQASLFHNYFEPQQKMQQSPIEFATCRPCKNLITANQCMNWNSLIGCNIYSGNFDCE